MSAEDTIVDKKTMDTFETVAYLDISIADLSRLTGITRMTLTRWRNGATGRDRIRAAMVDMTVKKLAAACKKDTKNFIEVKSIKDTKERVAKYRKLIKDTNL